MMKPIIHTLLAMALVAGSAFGQEKKEEATDSVVVGPLTFKFSKPWKKMQPTSSMRAAQLQYDSKDALKDIDAVFFKFGPQSVEANLKRWEGQFEGEADSKSEKKKFGETEVTFFTASGTYMDGPPFGGTKTPRENWVMMAAVIPMSDSVLFVKLVGPADAMGALEEDYKALVASPFTK